MVFKTLLGGSSRGSQKEARRSGIRVSRAGPEPLGPGTIAAKLHYLERRQILQLGEFGAGLDNLEDALEKLATAWRR